MAAANQIPPGYVGNLSAEQEIKLQEMWALVLKVFGLELGELENLRRPSVSSQGSSGSLSKKASKGSMFGGFLGASSKVDDSSSPGDSLSTSLKALSVADTDDKHGQAKQFQKVVSEVKPEQIRAAFWKMVKMNDPDSLLLRFLRARKWDVKKALVMFITTIHWRAAEAHIDDDIVVNGELHAKLESESTDQLTRKNGAEFMLQMREGKNFFRGVDKLGRPICVIRVCKHRASDQSVPVMERYTAFTIEMARMMLTDGVETATIIFDMTGFGMANMVSLLFDFETPQQQLILAAGLSSCQIHDQVL